MCLLIHISEESQKDLLNFYLSILLKRYILPNHQLSQAHFMNLVIKALFNNQLEQHITEVSPTFERWLTQLSLQPRCKTAEHSICYQLLARWTATLFLSEQKEQKQTIFAFKLENPFFLEYQLQQVEQCEDAYSSQTSSVDELKISLNIIINK